MLLRWEDYSGISCVPKKYIFSQLWTERDAMTEDGAQREHHEKDSTSHCWFCDVGGYVQAPERDL